ncbi:hypothetical protein LU604_04540 [Erwinia tracheiphila]|uniref:hypothetical protein n=1 Tax=Erwinia tracheiphila TaxID=65700 RepID=UPI001F1A3BD9|nr:hypothetical protein [Erwinia tracheiphila]UIA85860.1 hypothetical protein LU604_04540 [Erwinia tracheiphila]UIA94381.1 hypothetical protein LU632_04500 [Erwinia tracheiphila]
MNLLIPCHLRAGRQLRRDPLPGIIHIRLQVLAVSDFERRAVLLRILAGCCGHRRQKRAAMLGITTLR